MWGGGAQLIVYMIEYLTASVWTEGVRCYVTVGRSHSVRTRCNRRKPRPPLHWTCQEYLPRDGTQWATIRGSTRGSTEAQLSEVLVPPGWLSVSPYP